MKTQNVFHCWEALNWDILQWELAVVFVPPPWSQISQSVSEMLASSRLAAGEQHGALGVHPLNYCASGSRNDWV